MKKKKEEAGFSQQDDQDRYSQLQPWHILHVLTIAGGFCCPHGHSHAASCKASLWSILVANGTRYGRTYAQGTRASLGVQKPKLCSQFLHPKENTNRILMSTSYSVFWTRNFHITQAVIRVSSTWKLCVFIKGQTE